MKTVDITKDVQSHKPVERSKIVSSDHRVNKAKTAQIPLPPIFSISFFSNFLSMKAKIIISIQFKSFIKDALSVTTVRLYKNRSAQSTHLIMHGFI